MDPEITTFLVGVAVGLIGWFANRLVLQSDKTMDELDDRIEEVNRRNVKRHNEQEEEIKRLRQDLNKNVVRNSDLDRFEERMNRQLEQVRDTTIQRIGVMEKNISKQMDAVIRFAEGRPPTDA